MTDMEQPATRHELTVDEAMALAVDFLKQGRLRETDALCRVVLDLEPSHATALHYGGVVAHRQGDNQRALALLARSLELVPDQPDWYSNLGNVLQADGRLQGAMEAFRRAIALNPAHANAHNNLGVLLRAHGRLEEAETAYRTVIAIDPNHPEAYHNLGIVLQQTGRTPLAREAFCKALTLRPAHGDAHRHLALAYSVIGEPEKAIEACEEWLKAAPDDPRAHHALAAYSGRNVPARASDAYVKKVFDGFAGSFEAKLARLDYRAPALVGEALAAAVAVADGTLDVLDAGCGTGLCGPLLAPYARRLVGVDLSSGMLDLAREKAVYHELVQAELTSYLQQQSAAFDAILSADTLVYFGALDDVVAAAAGALRPGGLFIFTVEDGSDGRGPGGYTLQTHGRYTHHATYVEQLLARHGLEPSIGRGELRMESGLPVPGLVVRARKPEGAHVA